MLAAISGYNETDPASVDTPVPDFSRAFRCGRQRCAWVSESPFFDNLDPEIAKTLDAAIAVLGKLTASSQEIKLPSATIPRSNLRRGALRRSLHLPREMDDRVARKISAKYTPTAPPSIIVYYTRTELFFNDGAWHGIKPASLSGDSMDATIQ